MDQLAAVAPPTSSWTQNDWLHAHGLDRLVDRVRDAGDASELPVDLTAAVRDAFGAIPLQVDANSAYTLADAATLAELDRFDLR